ncbi:CRAL-TRIO domain-containing protein [Terfezia claveryi]|nr:CRAL-TRIO domain-containing protein [Terfezia claveryi]
MFLTRECLLRYLRAAKWDGPAAFTRLMSTLLWRREYAPHALPPEHVSPENETGKQWILGYDLNARPCLSLNPARQNTNPSDRQIQHLVFMLERAIDLMPPGQESLALKIDFAGASSGKTPSLSTGKQVLNILQNHYPERLGKAINLSLPWYVSAFYKLITPFVDPLTREKLVFPARVKDGEEAEIINYIPKEHLEKEVGGSCDFEYRHGVYWGALVELCENRRGEYERRWRVRGERIGESEVVLRGGVEEVVKN